jgi:uncharacterized membrane protein YgaE (UPF0421/DUF939 family)
MRDVAQLNSSDEIVKHIKNSAKEILKRLKNETRHTNETLSDIFEIDIDHYLSNEQALLKDTNKILSVHERLKKYV